MKVKIIYTLLVLSLSFTPLAEAGKKPSKLVKPPPPAMVVEPLKAEGFATSPALPDVRLTIDELSRTERLGASFQMSLNVMTTKPIEIETLIGQPMTITLPQEQGSMRYFRGYCLSVSSESGEADEYRYQIELGSALDLMTKSSDMRVMHHVTIPEAAKSVLDRYPQIKYELKLTGKYPAYETFTQYRETDRNFLDRTLQHIGAWYYFVEDEKETTLIITDSNAGAIPLSKTPIPFSRMGEGSAIKELSKSYKMTANRYTTFDRNFVNGYMSASSPEQAKKVNAPEMFDGPEYFQQPEFAAANAAVRHEENIAGSVELMGGASGIKLTSGSRFKLSEHPQASMNTDYLVTEVALRVSYRRMMNEMDIQFRAIPSENTYRPARITPLPVISSHQTAMVLPSEPDQWGRVKLRFFWDRHFDEQPNGGTWARVVQPLNGSSMQQPKAGDEVLVTFEEGNPDTPLVVGIVRNAADFKNKRVKR